jgi:hypothetical protein
VATVFHPPGVVRLITPAEQAAAAQAAVRAAPGPNGAPRAPTPSTHQTSAAPTRAGAVEEIEMANFSVRFAYPVDAPHPAADHGLRGRRAARRGLAAGLRRLARHLFRAIDEAPFDLAWPPSFHRWPAPSATPAAAAEAGDQRRPAHRDGGGAEPLRRAA